MRARSSLDSVSYLSPNGLFVLEGFDDGLRPSLKPTILAVVICVVAIGLEPVIYQLALLPLIQGGQQVSTPIWLLLWGGDPGGSYKGITDAPAWVLWLNSLGNAAQRVPGQCVDVAKKTFDAFKQMGLDPKFTVEVLESLP